MRKVRMPNQLDKGVWGSLRRCQQEGVALGLAYSSVEGRGPNPRSCLISLPTGAGKTGLIAVLAHYSRQERVLILCHRAAVRDQLIKELGGKFFKDKCPGFTKIPKNIHEDLKGNIQPGIYVATFQKLRLFSSEELELVRLKFDLIIVDEGHSEPAPVWSRLVRGAMAPRIIVTATPYRNDLFAFDIEPKWTYIYTFTQGVTDQVVFDPRFQKVDRSSITGAIRLYLQENPGTKCIVKCRDFNGIQEYSSLFSNEGFKVLAIHDGYSGATTRTEKVHVPEGLSDSDYEVIVHQHKLDEGVDLPSAKMLVLTYVVGSGRELVQAIGRVVRSYKIVPPVVLEVASDANEKIWTNYRRFDSSLNDASSVEKFVRSLNSAEIINNYLDVFPDYGYAEGAFVKKFQFNEFDIAKSLIIPTASVCFLHIKSDFDVNLAMDVLYWRATSCGELVRVAKHGSEMQVLLSISFSKSKFLIDEFFFEPKLEVLVMQRLENRCVAIYDSRSRRFSLDDELGIGAAIPQEKLLKLMAAGKSTKTKETTSKAISSTYNRPEVIVQKGPELERIGNDQENGARRISTIRFENFTDSGMKSASFYVGVDNGRIADQKQSKFTLDDLQEWFEDISSKFDEKAEARSALVDSYASTVEFDANRKAHSVIFDLSDCPAPIDVFYRGCKYSLDNGFLYFSYVDGFYLLPTPHAPLVQIQLISEEPHLSLTFSEPISFIVNGSLGTETYNGMEFLQNRVHKILLQDGVGYAEGKFYKLALPIRDGFDFDKSSLAGVLVERKELLNPILDEKGFVGGGIEVSDDEFHPNSVFYLLDMLKAKASPDSKLADLGPFYDYIGGIDLLSCTDMDTEPADFVLSSPTKLVFAHVKCGGVMKPMSSAGALAEVGSQAMKNLEMLISPRLELRPGNWNTLLKKWPSENARTKLGNRIRLFGGRRHSASGGLDGPEKDLIAVWDKVAERRIDTAVEKEIWIVSGNGFSLSHFRRQLKSGERCAAESLQAFQLIQSWIATAKNSDVRLRIFVAP